MSKSEKTTADRLLAERFAEAADALGRHLDPAIRNGDPHDIHQARVACRRLRGWTRSWAALIDDERIPPWEAQLRTTAAALGLVRDLDAIDITIRRASDRVGFADLPVGAVCREIERRRARAQERIRVDLDPGALLDTTRAIGGSISFHPRARRRADHVLPPLAKAQWRDLLRRVESLPSPVGPRSLHRVRIAAKRCRYGALDLAPAVGKPARRYAKAMRKLQDRIGGLEDASQAVTFLEAVGQNDGRTTATNAALLRGVCLTFVADGLEAWPDWWADASRKQLRSWW